MLVATLVTVAAVLALLLVEYRGSTRYRWLFKPLASGGFVAVALLAGPFDSAYGRAVLVALALAWLGDVALISAASASFLIGVLLFLSTHIALAVAFVLRGVNLEWALSVLPVVAVAGGSMGRWLLPKVKKRALRAAVAGYVAVLSTMLVLAVGAFGRAPRAPGVLLVIAAVAFYLSDLSVAFDRFVAPAFRNRAWGLPLYYGAQLLFAWSLPGA